jgi:hypothetical protein
MIVLVEVARAEVVRVEAGSSEKISLSERVVLVLLPVETDAVEVSSRFLPSRRVPGRAIKVCTIKVCTIKVCAIKALCH